MHSLLFDISNSSSLIISHTLVACDPLLQLSLFASVANGQCLKTDPNSARERCIIDSRWVESLMDTLIIISTTLKLYTNST